MVSRRMVLAGALAAGATRLTSPGTSAVFRADPPLGAGRLLLTVAALPEFEIFTGPFPVDDQFEVTYYYLEEHDDGYVSAKGELRNHGREPARPDELYVDLFDEHGVDSGYGLLDDIEEVVLPGESTPFWAFWSQAFPLSELGSIQFRRDATPDSREMEAPPVAFEDGDEDHHLSDEARNVGVITNEGHDLLYIGYKVAYYSPDNVVLWIDSQFKEPVAPGESLPVRVKGQDDARSQEISSTLEGLGVDPDDAIGYRVFFYVE